MRTIEAIFRNGVFLPTEPVNLPEGSRVSFTSSDESDAGDAVATPRGRLDPRAFAGRVGRLPVDPLAYQRAMRAEWDREAE